MSQLFKQNTAFQPEGYALASPSENRALFAFKTACLHLWSNLLSEHTLSELLIWIHLRQCLVCVTREGCERADKIKKCFIKRFAYICGNSKERRWRRWHMYLCSHISYFTNANTELLWGSHHLEQLSPLGRLCCSLQRAKVNIPFQAKVGREK